MRCVYFIRKNLIKEVFFLIIFIIITTSFAIKSVQAQSVNIFSYYCDELPYSDYIYPSLYYYDCSYFKYYNDWIYPSITNNFGTSCGLYTPWEDNFYKYVQLEDIYRRPAQLSNLYFGDSSSYWIFSPYWEVIRGYINSKPDSPTQDNALDANQTSHSVIAELDFQSIEKGMDSYYSTTKYFIDGELIVFELKGPTLFIIETQEEFKDFWAKHAVYFLSTDPIEAPLVDFEKELIIAVIDKRMPTEVEYSIEIDNVLMRDGNVIVEATKTGPVCNEPWWEWSNKHGRICQPYHIIKISQDDSYKSFSLSLDDLSINVSLQDFQTIFGEFSCHQGYAQPLYGPTLVKIENEPEFEDFLMNYCNISTFDLPLIDFEKELILALVDRNYCSAQYSINIEYLGITDEEVIVGTRKTGPVNCCVPRFYRQLHIIKTAKINKEFRLCH